MIQQRHWRIAGAIALAACGGMAFYGVNLKATEVAPWLFLAYWGLFFVLFIVVLYCVLLDLRYIRAEHAVWQREVFNETLGDEEFRRALREAQARDGRKERAGPGRDIR